MTDKPSLNDIGLANGTDKSTRYHGYLPVYAQALEHLRDEEFTLIEVGVFQGSSARMWADYFTRAAIVGVDLNPECRQYETERISIRIGDQGNRAFLGSLVADVDPLVVIDDGSHQWLHQIVTFQELFPAVAPGGVYICEDIPSRIGRYAQTYRRGHAQSGYDYLLNLALPIVAGVMADPPADAFEQYCRDTIESVVLLKHAVIIRKKPDAGRTWRRTALTDQAGSWVVGESETYDRVEGEVIGGSQYVGKALAALVSEGRVSVAAPASARLAGATVLPGGVCLTTAGEIIEESLNGVRNLTGVDGLQRLGGGERWYAVKGFQPLSVPAEPGVEYVLLKSAWDTNYGHWLVDVAPKLRLLQHLPLRGTPRFVVARQQPAMAQVVRDTLALAGFPNADLYELDAVPRRFDRLVVLGMVSHHPVSKSPSAIRFLEELGRDLTADTHRRIYLSRNRGTRRLITNEDELLPLLTERGYTVVAPETLALREQIALFKGASIVAGNLGAGFSNLVFSPPGVSVLALTTPAMAHDLFYDIVCHKGGRYRALQGSSPDPQADIGADFVIDPAVVAAGLAWVESGHGGD